MKWRTSQCVTQRLFSILYCFCYSARTQACSSAVATQARTAAATREEPAQAEPAWAVPTRVVPARAEAAREEPAQAEPARVALPARPAWAARLAAQPAEPMCARAASYWPGPAELQHPSTAAHRSLVLSANRTALSTPSIEFQALFPAGPVWVSQDCWRRARPVQDAPASARMECSAKQSARAAISMAS